MTKQKEKNNDKKFDLKAFLSVQKNRSRVYTAVFLLLVVIFFIINNRNNHGVEGPYPPDYSNPKSGSFKNAPAFTLETTDGNQIALEDYRGKVVVVEFWATWCGACQRLMPELVELKNSLTGQDFEIIGVSIDKFTGHDESSVNEFLKGYKINFPVAHGNQETISAYGNIETTPSTFVVDKTGKIYSIYTGLIPKEVLQRDLDNLLK